MGLHCIAVVVCSPCRPERQRRSTASCCLSVTFLLNISDPHPSLCCIVSRPFFKGVLCLRALLLTQVQGCTKITSPSTSPTVPLPLPPLPPVLHFAASSSATNCSPNITCFLASARFILLKLFFSPVSLYSSYLKILISFLSLSLPVLLPW